jgi:hypothetical protein
VTNWKRPAPGVPGQAGLVAGILPDSEFTYASLNVNYSANALNDSNGNKLPGITGTLIFWAIENALYYAPKIKILGGSWRSWRCCPLPMVH